MSNAGQAAAGIVGGAIGFLVGGPVGALYGFQVGLLAGTLLSPTQLPGIEGPRLEDFETVQADPGAPVFKGWGTFVVPGFRMYLGEPITITNTQTQGGKGPPEQDVTTFTYTQTLALGLCEGEIPGVRRIWENGKLVYDRREQLAGESDADFEARLIMSDEYKDTFVLYLGDETQLADPTLELEQGAGNVPGFRGLAYMVYPDRLLKSDQANRHPVFKIEIAEPVALPRVVAVAQTGTNRCMYSDDAGATWTPVAIQTAAWTGVCNIAGGKYAAVGTGGAMAWSDDGAESWTLGTISTGPAVIWSAVTSSPSLGRQLAVGGISTSGAMAYSDDEGHTWTRVVAGTDFTDIGILSDCYWAEDLGLFVVGREFNAANQILYSPTGLPGTWTRPTAPGNIRGICSNGSGLLVSCGGNIQQRNWTVNIAVGWNTVSVGFPPGANNSLCWAATQFVGVPRTVPSASYRPSTSVDGNTWVSRTPSTNDKNWLSVCYEARSDTVIAVAANATANTVMVSGDRGVTWATVQPAEQNEWTGVCAGTGA